MIEFDEKNMWHLMKFRFGEEYTSIISLRGNIPLMATLNWTREMIGDLTIQGIDIVALMSETMSREIDIAIMNELIMLKKNSFKFGEDYFNPFNRYYSSGQFYR
jgi:hypothetical protein